MVKQFRQHRGTLTESLKTSVEVNGLDDIKKYLKNSGHFLKNIKILNDPIFDNRQLTIGGDSWGSYLYKVVGDIDGVKLTIDDNDKLKAVQSYLREQCVGFCNFYEE